LEPYSTMSCWAANLASGDKREKITEN